MYLHTEIDNFEPQSMKKGIEAGTFFLFKMVPPRSRIKYYFSTDSADSIYIADNQNVVYLTVKLIISVNVILILYKKEIFKCLQ